MNRLQELVAFYETLTPASLARLGEFYADGAGFKDPFNEVSGLPAIRRIFEHMFAALETPRFAVTDTVCGEGRAALTWEFHFRRQDRDWRIRGATWLRFDADDLVIEHRDYWDAAEELYAKLPLIGQLMRWLQRRLAA